MQSSSVSCWRLLCFQIGFSTNSVPGNKEGAKHGCPGLGWLCSAWLVSQGHAAKAMGQRAVARGGCSLGLGQTSLCTQRGMGLSAVLQTACFLLPPSDAHFACCVNCLIPADKWRLLFSFSLWSQGIHLKFWTCPRYCAPEEQRGIPWELVHLASPDPWLTAIDSSSRTDDLVLTVWLVRGGITSLAFSKLALLPVCVRGGLCVLKWKWQGRCR